VRASAEASAGGVPRPEARVLMAVGMLAVVTLVLLIVGNGDVGVALAPLALTFLVVLVAKLPLRTSLVALAVLCVTLECPSEIPASNKWQSPLYILGALLHEHLNYTLPYKSLFFSGLDLILVLLAVVWAARRMMQSEVDVRGHVPPARPLRTAALLCLFAVLVVWGHGMLRSGADFRFSLWQIFRLVYLPCIFLLCTAGIRGPSDSRGFGIALVAAALIRALLAIYVRHLFPDVEDVPHTTSHADSMLFTDAFVLLLALFFERPTVRNLLVALATLPVISWGMIANNRRLAWVELGVALIVIYFITPLTPLKKRIAQSVALSLPILVLYCALGWSSGSRVFAPVRTIRSVVDSGTDSSTRWRDFENYNLYYTVKEHPLLGTGFGHGYEEVIKLPDISKNYELYRFAPHNSILGLLAYSGYFGFAGIWLPFALGMFFAVRSYRFSTTPRDRVTALTAVAILVSYLVHCYGDMGLGTWASVFTVGPALALVAKQAVVTGAWPLPPRRSPAHARPRSG
jgi:O-Antigen ligase